MKPWHEARSNPNLLLPSNKLTYKPAVGGRSWVPITDELQGVYERHVLVPHDICCNHSRRAAHTTCRTQHQIMCAQSSGTCTAASGARMQPTAFGIIHAHGVSSPLGSVWPKTCRYDEIIDKEDWEQPRLWQPGTQDADCGGRKQEPFASAARIESSVNGEPTNLRSGLRPRCRCWLSAQSQ